jgi:hypothetical protein
LSFGLVRNADMLPVDRTGRATRFVIISRLPARRRARKIACRSGALGGTQDSQLRQQADQGTRC